MKKLLILPAVLLMATPGVRAQDNGASMAKANPDKKEAKAEKKEAKKELRKLKGAEVGVMAKNQFYQDFGKQDVTWKRSSYFDEASFVQDGKKMTAYYDNDGELVGTTSPAMFSDIAVSAQNKIKKDYKGYNIDRAILFDDNEENPLDMILYGTEVSDEDNYFVELTKGAKTVIVKVNMEGEVSFFTEKK
ncbi:MAG: hypothetical protein EOO01_41830 [Chitinophagaceae bacterium]|nr:MAG: hypothetical protein EOO01_41830 [Chitinophagaceae bacterium]